MEMEINWNRTANLTTLLDMVNYDHFNDIDPAENALMNAMKFYLHGIVIPVVCAFGFVGNVLNVFVFCWKRHQRIMDEIERCTTTCLVALALSDMMFCVSAFPSAFASHKDCYYRSFMLYYMAFRLGIIDFFILTSTMLTVTTAIMRYMAICHPFQSSHFVSMKTTISSLVVVCLVALAISLPKLWRYEMESDMCNDPDLVKLDPQTHLFGSEMFEHSYRLMWAIVGNFIPLVILLYCNVRLIVALRQSKQLRIYHSRDNDTYASAHRRITITLITIIIFFLILVAPSEIIKFVLNTKKGSYKNYTFQKVSMITNVLQSINFSVNFILYYVIIAPFRRAFHDFVCITKRSSTQTKNSKNYCFTNSKQHTVLLMSVRENGVIDTEVT